MILDTDLPRQVLDMSVRTKRFLTVHGPRRTSLIGFLVLLAAILASANEYSPRVLDMVVVAGGRIAFERDGLTVLDVRTGAVIVRERRTKSIRLWETPQGVLVEEPGTRVRLFSTQGDPSRRVDCGLFTDAKQTTECSPHYEPAGAVEGRMFYEHRVGPEPVWREDEKSLRPELDRLQEGELVSFDAGWTGTILELRSKRGHWQALLPYHGEARTLRVTGAFERDGKIFIESTTWGFGILDCLDLASGRPLWRYFFAGWTSRDRWQQLQQSPPLRIQLLPRWLSTKEIQGLVGTLWEGVDNTAEPVRFDPAPFPSRMEVLMNSASDWIPWVIALAVFVVLLRKRFAPLGSRRRRLLKLGLVTCLLLMTLRLIPVILSSR